MPSVKSILGFSHLHLLYDLFVLSTKITFAMIVAAVRILIPPRAKKLLGETALITGAGHGIGRELAIQLGSLGCIIVCWDIESESIQATMSMVSKNGGEVYGFVVDVSKRAGVQKAARLMRKMGVPEVSILINNAAILHHDSILTQDSDLVEKTFRVNVLSNFWTIETFLPGMMKNGKGHIVCVSSMCGIYGVSQKVAYCSSKFAVRGLMEALREELRLDCESTDVRLTTIYPFYVDTGLARDPKYRFPYVFGVVTPRYAAAEIIKAMRRNYTEYSIPRCLFTLNSVNSSERVNLSSSKLYDNSCIVPLTTIWISFCLLFIEESNRLVPETVMRLILDFLANVDEKRRERLAT